MQPLSRQLSIGLAAALCAFAPVALGSVHLWAVAVCTGLALALLGLVLHRRFVFDALSMRVGWTGAAFVALTAWTALQLVPLPPSLLSTLSPKAHEILEFTVGPFGLYGETAWRPLSLDPPATAQELLRLVGLTAAYLAATNGFYGRGEATHVYRAIALVGGLLVVIGVAQKLAGVRDILGLYQSTAAASQFFTSTFVNPNHLAAMLGLAAPLAFGLCLSEERTPAARVLFGAAGLLAATGVFLSLSRAGIAAFLFGQVVLLALLLRRYGRDFRRTAALVACLLTAIGAAALVAFERLSAEISFTLSAVSPAESLKLEMWKDSLPLIRDFAVAGVGKGAFPAVYPLYQSHLAQYTFTHVESGPLQAVVDFGVAAGAFLLVVVTLAVGRAVVRASSSVGCGAAAAVVTVAAHNFADYNLEISGVAFPFVIALGLLCRPERSGSAAARARPRQPGSAILCGASILAGAAALATVLPYARAEHKDRAVARLKAAAATSANDVERALARELDHHPADYLVFLAAAARVSGPPLWDPGRALRWANRAVYLNGASFEAHIATGRILRRMGRPRQALLEYRLAARRKPQALERVFDELATLPDAARAMREIAENPEDRHRLAEWALGKGRPAEAAALAAEMLRSNPEDAAALGGAARAALALGRREEAIALARRLEGISGHEARAAMIAGDAHRASGRLIEALSAYERARRVNPRLGEAYVQIASAHLARGAPAAAREALAHLGKVDIWTASRPHVAMMLAQAWELEGKPDLALREYRRVLQAQPENAHAAARVKALEAVK
jgi:tetratricopeptide (TPR) repeat protein